MDNEWDELTAGLPGWVETSRQHAGRGTIAQYIPELADAPAGALGAVIRRVDTGQSIAAGDSGLRFTMQSISKVFTLILALMDRGEAGVFAKVGMEPTGDDFNSMLKLELVEPGIPFNPLINAGAITVTSLIAGDGPDARFARILSFFRRLTGDETLDYNERVCRSEAASAHRNRSLAYFLKDNKVLGAEDDVEDILSVYFRHCAIEVDCGHLARLGALLAADGQGQDGTALIPRRYVQIAKTFMISCGMYNASGEFAIKAGIPAKSGVAGGIMAVVPGKYGIGVVGPALNRYGNSTAGVHLLETLSGEFGWSIF